MRDRSQSERASRSLGLVGPLHSQPRVASEGGEREGVAGELLRRALRVAAADLGEHDGGVAHDAEQFDGDRARDAHHDQRRHLHDHAQRACGDEGERMRHERGQRGGAVRLAVELEEQRRKQQARRLGEGRGERWGEGWGKGWGESWGE
eukprot:scaffold116435_cov90-Phaeocystis_antarctica.AAC.1